MNMMMIGGMSCPCCCDGMVTVSMEEGSSAKISVLVVCGKPIGFDLLLGIDAIKALGAWLLNQQDRYNSATRKLSSVQPFPSINPISPQLSTITTGPGLWHGSGQRGAHLRH